MPDSRRNPPSTDELRELIVSLIDGWTLRADESLDVAGTEHPAFVATLWGLAAHAHECGRAVLALLDADVPHLLLAPHVRNVLEFGVTAHWLIRVKDGTESILNETLRQQRNFHATLRGIPVPHYQVPKELLVAVSGPDYDTTSGSPARRFNARCDDLNPGGKELYANYSALSMMCHAGDHVVDAYAELRGDGEYPPVTIRIRPREDEDLLPYLLWVTAMSLLWAGQAVDVKRRSHPRRRELHAAAAELSVQIDLKASDAVWLRENKPKT